MVDFPACPPIFGNTYIKDSRSYQGAKVCSAWTSWICILLGQSEVKSFQKHRTNWTSQTASHPYFPLIELWKTDHQPVTTIYQTISKQKPKKSYQQKQKIKLSLEKNRKALDLSPYPSLVIDFLQLETVLETQRPKIRSIDVFWETSVVVVHPSISTTKSVKVAEKISINDSLTIHVWYYLHEWWVFNGEIW